MTPRVLDPALRERIATLAVTARKALDGALSGAHRSARRGASMVFVEHREYRPGDDVRRLDWRAYARTGRPTLKHFEQEAQLTGILALDGSASMEFGSPRSKRDHAATLLAALGARLLDQGDAAGALRFDERVVASVPPRAHATHLEPLLEALSGPAEGPATDLATSLDALGALATRKRWIAIASDLLDLDPDGALRAEALAAIGRLVARGHEVRVFQVLHPDELELPGEGPTRFVGLEGDGTIETDPSLVRARYREEARRFVDSCRTRCVAMGASHQLVRTDAPIERALAEALSSPWRGR